MKNQYKYLVKYNCKGGIGVFDCTMSRPITSFNDTRRIKEHLEKTHELENVGVESYVLVSKREGNRKFIK